MGRVEHGGAGAVVARKLSQAFFGLPPLVAGALGATLLVGVCVAVWLVTSGRWDLRARPATAQGKGEPLVWYELFVEMWTHPFM
ncbi:hypothetical protein R6G99_09965, partial [Actinotignum timonense]|nr:hypothetical protein [Actinotignum timonense]